DWCCVPRFDHGSCFAAILDAERGGALRLRHDGGSLSGEQRYVEDTMVLETILHGPGGSVRVLDALVVWPDRPPAQAQLVRVLEGVEGELQLDLSIAVRFDYGELRPWLRRDEPGLVWAIGGDDGLLISWDGGDLELDGHHDLQASARLAPGVRRRLTLTAAGATAGQRRAEAPSPAEVDRRLDETIAWWRREAGRIEGRASAQTRRSALVLRALTFEETGAIVAAPTTSLPEVPGGERNWDYRYSWIRDSSFAVRSLGELGLEDAAHRFGRFVLRSAAGHVDELQILFAVDGAHRVAEQVVDLAGYGGARPVRIGNAAAGQRQVDALGELVRTRHDWHARGVPCDADDWRFVRSLVEYAARAWREPDRGLWEWRDGPRHFVHSKAACWAALDRGIRLARELDPTAPVDEWAAEREAVGEAIATEGFDERRGTFRQAFGHDDLDAAVLLLPVTGVVAWDDERMLSTADVIAERLDDDGLVRRYDADDGLAGREGAFLPCSFWLAELYARQGRLERARETYERALQAASPLGLLSEEYDTRTGQALGNFPQALTHLAQVAAAVAIESAALRPPARAARAVG
ncbi:MAG TPA: glycoside hydrolase family 15 protein, partial [Capillimicrobium sp.]|nr:glycoside hydrolase family 15 protein [Capillimicrobium sp.]